MGFLYNMQCCAYDSVLQQLATYMKAIWLAQEIKFLLLFFVDQDRLI